MENKKTESKKSEQKAEAKINKVTFIDAVLAVALNKVMTVDEIVKKSLPLCSDKKYTAEKATAQMGRIIADFNKKRTAKKWADYSFEIEGKGKDKKVKMVCKA